MISRLRKIGQYRIITVILHIVAWTVIFFIPPVFVFSGTGQQALYYQLRTINGPLTLALIFYANYLYLCPRLLEKKNLSPQRFVILNLLIYLLGVGMMDVMHQVVDSCFRPDIPPPCVKPGLTPWQMVILKTRDVMLYFFITVLAVLVHTSIKWQEAELAREKAERENADANLRILRLQVSPHFLLNTLNNIYALIDINTEKAKETVQNLSRLLSHILYSEDKLFTSLHTEVDFIKNYIELMKIRYSDKLEMSVNLDSPVDHKIQFVNLVAITLIENAFKHGVVPNCKCRVDVSLTVDPETGVITFRTLNTNHPKSPSDLSGHGLGLKQVQARLELAYPGCYTWEKGLDENGYYVSTITIKPTKDIKSYDNHVRNYR